MKHDSPDTAAHGQPTEMRFERDHRKGILFELLTLLMFLLSLAYTLVATWLGLIGVLLFGFMLAMLIAQKWPGASYMKLDPGGFEQHAPFSTVRTAWVDVERFELRQLELFGLPRDVIAVFFRSATSADPARRAMAGALGGAERAIADLYGTPVDRVFATLVEWHRRYADAPIGVLHEDRPGPAAHG